MAAQVFAVMSHRGSQHSVFDLSCSDVGDHELFDDMPCWDSDAEQDDLPSSVIWDEELLHDFEPHAVLSEVIWDDEMSTKPDMESELLQLLASGGGYLDDEKVEMTVELNDNKVIGNMLNQENDSSFNLDADINSMDSIFTGRALDKDNAGAQADIFIVDVGRNVADSMFIGMALDEDNAGAQARSTIFRDLMGRKSDALGLFCEMPSKIMWDDIPSGNETSPQLVMGYVLPCFASTDTISQVIDNHDEANILLVICHELLCPGKPSTRSAHYWSKEWLPSSCNVFSPGKLKMKSIRSPANAKFNKAFQCGGESELITAVFLWSHLLSLSRSITKNFDQGADLLVLFTVGVDSEKQGICPLCLADKVHGVPGLYDGMKLKLYQEINALVYIVQSVRYVTLKRPWDPGVHVIRQADTEKEGERPWDPGIIMATAWGQAVFRGAGNVMTQGWPRRSPTYPAQRSPLAKGNTTKAEQSTGIRQRRRNSEKKKRRAGGRLPPSDSRDPIPLSIPAVATHAPG